jgi:hypothetical protein
MRGGCSISGRTSMKRQSRRGGWTPNPHPAAPTRAPRWRRWESKTSVFARFRATTGNHRKPDSELEETKDEKKHVRENALPTGKIEHETGKGRADVGDVPTAQTLGMLARKILSSSRHADSRRLARAVLRLLALSKPQS